jgi:hypothetical protein
LGIHSETLRERVRQAEADAGARPEPGAIVAQSAVRSAVAFVN